jgi:hypothetical protein
MPYIVPTGSTDTFNAVEHAQNSFSVLFKVSNYGI